MISRISGMNHWLIDHLHLIRNCLQPYSNLKSAMYGLLFMTHCFSQLMLNPYWDGYLPIDAIAEIEGGKNKPPKHGLPKQLYPISVVHKNFPKTHEIQTI